MLEVGKIKLYDSNEVCALLGVSYATLLRYWRTGLIVPTKIGNKKFTTEEALVKFVNAQTKPSKKRAK